MKGPASSEVASDENDASSVEYQSSSHPILNRCRKLGGNLSIKVEDKQSGFMVSMSGETIDGDVVETDRAYVANDQLISNPTLFDSAVAFLLKQFDEKE